MLKKGKWLPLAGIALALSLAFSAAGCGGKGTGGEESLPSGTSAVSPLEQSQPESPESSREEPSEALSSEPSAGEEPPEGSALPEGTAGSQEESQSISEYSEENSPQDNHANTQSADSSESPNPPAQKPSAPNTAAGPSGSLASPAVSGKLQVVGSQLCDSRGNPVQLRGISTHGLAWYPDYVNAGCFQELRQNWQANVIRLAMYTAEYGGYCSGGDQKALKDLIRKGVSLAAEADMYVIVDWHILSDGNPNTHIEEAKGFFKEMAAEFSGYSHVLYEICNEPNGGVSWAQIKNYAQEIIPVIREADKDAVILVGTPTWSQEADKAAADPITGFDNIMYTLHFYAATHTDSLRGVMTQAVEGGLPVFVSEYGICDASGSGAIDETQANLWVQAMDRLGVSYVAWNLSNKGETSALLNSSCNKTSGFGQEDLSASGQWLYRLLTGAASLPEGTSPATPPQNPPEESGSSSSSVPAASEESAPPIQQGSGNLSWTATVENSWESDGKTFRLYRLSIQNTSSAPLDGWEITLEFEGEAALSDGWCGEFSVQGNILAITPLDYNRQIPVGGTVDNVGFIVSLSGS